MKKIIICVLSMFLGFHLVFSSSVFASAPRGPQNAWPGRPGGNGDGSEEWLQGSYGEMNGPYVRIAGPYTGMVSDLNASRNTASNIGFTIVGALTGFLGISPIAATAVGLSPTIVSTMLGSVYYHGSVYRVEVFVSGRRMKTLVTTYGNENFTGTKRVYEHIKKW